MTTGFSVLIITSKSSTSLHIIIRPITLPTTLSKMYPRFTGAAGAANGGGEPLPKLSPHSIVRGAPGASNGGGESLPK